VITCVSVPSCGYTTVVLDKKIDYEPRAVFFNHTSEICFQIPDSFVLENELVRAVLNPLDGSIASFLDKKTGSDLAFPGGGFGIFRLAQEALQKGVTGWRRHMSAWIIGRFKSIENLGKGFEIKSHAQGDLRNVWHLSFNFGHASTLEAVISLDSGSRLLRYDITCDWREFGSDDGIPNLHFHLPLGWKPAYLFDIPFGVKERKPVDMDLPGESFVIAKKSGGPSLGLLSMDKYGFRCLENSLSLTLIRGSVDPDPTPETGRHYISFALVPFGASESNEDIVRESLIYRRAMTVISGKNKAAKTQDLEPSGSFLKLKGGVLSAIKRAEAETAGAQEDKKLVFRVYEVQGKDTTAELSLAFAAASAFTSDAIEEKHLEDCHISEDGKTITFKLPKYSVRTLFVVLK